MTLPHIPPRQEGGFWGKNLARGAENFPNPGGGSIFYAKKLPKNAIFSKNKLFLVNICPGVANLVKKFWPGEGRFRKELNGA